MTTASPFAVYIPAMHQELVPVVVRFLPLFDPGCGQEEGYRPQDLPMDPREARHYQREMLAWGREVDKPSDLASLAAQMQGDPMVRVTNDLRGELAELSRMAGTGTSATASPTGAAGTGPGEELQDPRTSQMVLLLAWAMEEAVLEAAKAGADLDAKWESFSGSLGLEDGEAPDAALERAMSAKPLNGLDAVPMAPPWSLVLEHQLRFLLPSVLLVTSSSDMREAWEEAGLEAKEMSPLQAADLLPGLDPDQVASAARYTGPGWKMLGLAAPTPGKDWLTADRTVITLEPKL